MTSYSKQNLCAIAPVFLCLVLPSLLIELLDAIAFFSNDFSFRFDRQRVAQGEWWRLLVGHFDHLGWNHFVLNSVFLALLLSLFQGLNRVSLVVPLVYLLCLSISALMWWFSPELQWYVGLSGALYGLLVFALWRDQSYPKWLRLAVLFVLSFKIVSEQLAGGAQAVSEFISGPIAVDAHLYGLVSGLVAVLVVKFLRI